MAHPVIILPQRCEADVSSDRHIAQEGHSRILGKPCELIDDVLHTDHTKSCRLPVWFWTPGKCLLCGCMGCCEHI